MKEVNIMANYYLNLNAQSNGDHEVHKDTCQYYFLYVRGYNFELLGSFYSEIDAVRYARSKHPNLKIDGCKFCCPRAHNE